MRTAIAVMLLLPAAADAATIEVVPLKDKRFASVITVTGKIKDGDHRVFREKLAQAARPVIVAFNSQGGHLIAGLDIGEQIKAGGLATLVPSMMTCASACALAWLAGSPRYMQGKVGFHAVFNEKDHEVSSVDSCALAHTSRASDRVPHPFRRSAGMACTAARAHPAELVAF